MKKLYATLLLILLFIIIFTIQIALLNKIKLFGVVANLILVTVSVVALWYNIYISSTFAFFCGIITDVLFSFSIGKAILIYLIVSIAISTLSKIYRKESAATIVYVVTIGTVIFETAMAISSLGINEPIINLWQYIFLIIKASLLNIGLGYIIRKFLIKFTIKITKNLNIYVEG